MPQLDARISVRLATVADAATIAHHRAAMFAEMGAIEPDAIPTLVADVTDWLVGALPRGEYLGWMVTADTSPDVVAGAGVQLRTLLPRPSPDGRGVIAGQQALIVNVYVEPAWRRQGLARRLMLHVLAWSREAGIASVVLHASAAGRGLYETLGFKATTEMLWDGDQGANG